MGSDADPRQLLSEGRIYPVATLPLAVASGVRGLDAGVVIGVSPVVCVLCGHRRWGGGGGRGGVGGVGGGGGGGGGPRHRRGGWLGGDSGPRAGPGTPRRAHG